MRAKMAISDWSETVIVIELNIIHVNRGIDQELKLIGFQLDAPLNLKFWTVFIIDQ